ncbi:MAG: CRTAC1 family protein [Acidobacteriota bacterium]
MTRRLGALVVTLALLGIACQGEKSAAPGGGERWFEDVAAESGLDFVHDPGQDLQFWFPEIMGGGAALLDHDDDGDLDLYLVQGGELAGARNDSLPGNRLYRNDGTGRFEDVTEQAGVGDRGYGMGATCADHDADGDVDLYVTNVGANTLYRNQGDGRFADVTARARVGDPSWSSSAAFLDHDRDGDLDLFVVNYVQWAIGLDSPWLDAQGNQTYCSPKNYAPARDRLYRNDGDGTFTDVSEAAGIWAEYGNGLGIAVGDLDDDGNVDVYVANDGTANQLWRNQGGGRFRNEAMLSGTAVNADGRQEAGMGVLCFDVENDGDLDLFMTHLRAETNTLYVNRSGHFTDATAGSGLATESFPFTGFGTGHADFDHDGHGDLFIVNGRVTSSGTSADESAGYAEPNLLFPGRGNGRFATPSTLDESGSALAGVSRAAAFGDVDGDGDTDVVVVELGERVRLLRNEVGSERGSWLLLRCLDEGRDALGATVRVATGERVQHRTVQVAYSYLASNDPRVHFGLADVTDVASVQVRWADGSREDFGPLEVSTEHVLRRGEGRNASGM